MPNPYVKGDLVAFNNLPDAVFFEVIGVKGMGLELIEAPGNAPQWADYSTVAQCKPKGASKSVWIVNGGMSWGKGPTLRAALLTWAEHAGTYTVGRVSKVNIRRYTPNEAHTHMSDADFDALVYVDELGNGVLPLGATVSNLNIPLTNHLSKALVAFAEAWDEFTCTEAMDEAFDGDLTEGGR